MNIIIEEIVANPILQIDNVINQVNIEVSDVAIPGQKGDKGDVGLQGIQGEIGLTGKSAYQSALDGGFVGTELEFNESLANQINFSQVNTYALMLSITVYSKLIIVKVLNDENKGIENTIYHIYPDGVRMWIASVQDN